MSGESEHLRGAGQLRGLRGRRAVVAVCRDDAAPWEAHRGALAAEGAELVLEPVAGALSARTGRPRVVVCDRWQEVVTAEPDAAPDDVLATVRWLGMCCEECPQAIHEPGGEGWTVSR